MVITAHFEAKWMDSGFQNYLSTIAETSKLTKKYNLNYMNKNKVTTEELAAYFWEQGDITTKERVDVVFHEDTLVNVSVTLRNVEDEVETMVQIGADFDPVQDFIDAFAITDVAQVSEITLVDMLVLYKEGLAEMEVIAGHVG